MYKVYGIEEFNSSVVQSSYESLQYVTALCVTKDVYRVEHPGNSG